MTPNPTRKEYEESLFTQESRLLEEGNKLRKFKFLIFDTATEAKTRYELVESLKLFQKIMETSRGLCAQAREDEFILGVDFFEDFGKDYFEKAHAELAHAYFFKFGEDVARK